MRDRRDAARVATVLAALSSTAREGRNIMPAVVEAVKAYATVGEITARLAEVYGRYHEPVRF